MQIIEIIRKNGSLRVEDLRQSLKITPQAIHRHLRDLERDGRLTKIGFPPQTHYQLSKPQPAVVLSKEFKSFQSILSIHPAICLVTLFGSQAREDANLESDWDLLVWTDPIQKFSRHDIWNFWDRQARDLPWKDKVSLIVRKLNHQDVCIDTLLLDFPEEHLLIFDKENWYQRFRNSILVWRKQWGAQKLPSFGGKHGWRYSSKVKNLSEIDFRLEL